MLRQLYNMATLGASFPLFFLMLLKPRGRAKLWERYGLWHSKLEDCVWFHGASVGEINGLIPVMNRVKAGLPDLPILVSATSVTALEKAGSVAEEAHLLPLDNPLWLSLALKSLRVRAFVFSETELWPALISYLHRRQVPMCLVNARISDYSYPRYRRLRPLLAPILSKLSMILASSSSSAERFVTLGAAPEKVEVAGNSKYDLKPAVTSGEEAQRLRKLFFQSDAPVVVLGSLRPDEEAFWFPVLAQIKARGQELNVIVAPRHAERFAWFEARLKEFGLPYGKWSEHSQDRERGCSSLIFLDTMGDLAKVYSFADLAFVGGTLADYGGHNPLEPAPYGCCIALGPYVANILELAQHMEAQRAVMRITSQNDIEALLQRVVECDPELKYCGRRACEFWKETSGATDRIYQRIKSYLE
jgi:3-deoxy-D-manno-octulosonic-acid transferase